MRNAATGKPLTAKIKLSRLFITVNLVCLMSVTALAQKKASIETLQETGKTFATIAKDTSKAVVGIQAAKSMKSPQYGGDGNLPFDNPLEREFFEKFFKRQMPRGRNQQRKQRAQGSGFAISSDGYILTNNHVVGGADEITVKFSDEKEYEAEIIGADPDSDVAVIKIDAENVPYLKLADSEDILVGEWVLAVGNPFGFSHSVTAGIISAKGRSGVGVAAYEDFIQTDAAINPGNSGGPLLNLKGEVIGINTAIISRTGGNLGIGLAIPSNMAKYIYDQLLEGGKVVRGYLGVTIQDLTPDLAESFGIDDSRGVLIPDVAEGSAADKGGIEQGDIILKLDGENIEKADELRNKVAMLEPGTDVDVVVLRDGRKKTLTVTLGTRPSSRQLAGGMKGEPDAGSQLGITVQELTDDIAERLGYEDVEGVVISGIKPGSPAASAGLRTGMLIREVNSEEVSSVREFVNDINEAKENGRVLLLVNTGSFNRYFVLNFPED